MDQEASIQQKKVTFATVLVLSPRPGKTDEKGIGCKSRTVPLL